MNKKVYLIAGATDGIGRIAALDLALQNPEADLLIHGRNKEKLNRSVGASLPGRFLIRVEE